MKKQLLAAALLSTLALSTLTPASAAMMACTGENMAKSQAAVMAMPDSPGKMGMQKEIAMANTEISKGNMRAACSHYMKAQKMSMMKSGTM